jgi:hypothetical protein
VKDWRHTEPQPQMDGERSAASSRRSLTVDMHVDVNVIEWALDCA